MNSNHAFRLIRKIVPPARAGVVDPADAVEAVQLACHLAFVEEAFSTDAPDPGIPLLRRIFQTVHDGRTGRQDPMTILVSVAALLPEGGGA